MINVALAMAIVFVKFELRDCCIDECFVFCFTFLSNATLRTKPVTNKIPYKLTEVCKILLCSFSPDQC